MQPHFNFWGRTELAELADEGTDSERTSEFLRSYPGLIDLRSTPYQPTPLLAAFTRGKATRPFLDLLVKYHPKMNATCFGGRNGLHLAANACNVEHLDFLMKQPECPSINSKMENYNTPLHAACMNGKLDATLESRMNTVNYLLEYGADPEAKNQDGLTPRDLAWLQGFDAISHRLKNDRPCETSLGFPEGENTPLDFWDQYRLEALAFDGENLSEAKKILSKNPNCVDEVIAYHPTPLLLAVSCGQADIDFIKLLLQYEARLDATYYGGLNILHCASNAANLAHFTCLIDLPNCPDVNSKTDEGLTPLIAVCMQGTRSATSNARKKIARMLIDRGGDPFITNNQGLNAIQIAREQGLSEIAEFISEYIANPLLSSRTFTPMRALTAQQKQIDIPSIEPAYVPVEKDSRVKLNRL